MTIEHKTRQTMRTQEADGSWVEYESAALSSVEITENSKGEPRVTVKIYAADEEEGFRRAFKVFNLARAALSLSQETPSALFDAIQRALAGESLAKPEATPEDGIEAKVKELAERGAVAGSPRPPGEIKNWVAEKMLRPWRHLLLHEKLEGLRLVEADLKARAAAKP